MVHKGFLYVTVLLALILSGCWGQRDIENLGFVIGTAIDVEEEKSSGEKQLKMTNQTVVPPLLGNPIQGAVQGMATKNLSSTGSSLLEINDNIDALSERVPFYEHLKLIVLSEKAVSEPYFFPKVMDFFLREGEMRREIRIVISEKEASAIMDIQPEGEQLPSIYIDSIFENTESQTLQILTGPRIGDIHELLLSKYSYAIPLVKVTEQNAVQMDEAVVFSGATNSVVGKLTKEEVMGLNLIRGRQVAGIIDFQLEDQQMSLQMTDLLSNISMDVSDLENIKISIAIEIEGFIDEMFSGKSVMNDNYLEEIEKAIVKRAEDLMTATIKKGQEELQIDFFNFSRKMYGNHYNQWQKIKDDWDQGKNYFANNTTIDVSVEVDVEAIGATDKVKR